MDHLLEQLFDQKLFTIVYGALLYFLTVWSISRNKVSQAKKARLDIADSKDERNVVEEDPRYRFSTREWLHDQKDEIIITLVFSVLLIEFDDVAIKALEIKFADYAPIWEHLVYLMGGVIGQLVYRFIKAIIPT